MRYALVAAIAFWAGFMVDPILDVFVPEPKPVQHVPVGCFRWNELNK